MARYIDADALIAEYDRVHIGAPGGARKLMVEAPTADVAPKSEVAREIFEEIEKILSSYKILPVPPMDFQIISLNDLAELKKKYTEGEK